MAIDMAVQVQTEFIRSAVPLIPAPEGCVWHSVGHMAYHKAEQDGVPTIEFMFHNDDAIAVVYLVGRPA